MKFVIAKTALQFGSEHAVLLSVPDHLDVEKERCNWSARERSKLQQAGAGMQLLEFVAYLESLGAKTVNFQSCRI